MIFYNCKNNELIKEKYGAEMTGELEEFSAEFYHNTSIKGDVCVCYLGEETEKTMGGKDVTLHNVLCVTPCADGKVRSYIERWTSDNGQFSYHDSMDCADFDGDDEDASRLCRYIIGNKLKISEVYAKFKRLANDTKKELPPQC